ncbi:hypothetical protein TRFO_27274 [Tritrichomonas foetus]|uniref:Uncharacterized protein n=1 Tax=Tritrichomonas foetus TaxID=1144522 RepID=A0A1J4K627_9EUKA|nr:hypothetical protein TRFO_27274 [Tritrichomonas foetus]|eukprot:OHT05142.1 hypothetical protein TRFO_27274 [Tritrichomonas foetus]
MSEQPAHTPENEQIQEFDIQHDDEFEDFKVKCPKAVEAQQNGEWLDDWDDDIVEDFTAILTEQRKLIQ